YSIGCPGDSEGDVYLSEDDNIANLGVSESGNQYAAAKFSLYPLGGGDYMDIIYEQIDAMKKYVSVKPAHYSTKLKGDMVHTVKIVSISANNPSHDERK